MAREYEVHPAISDFLAQLRGELFSPLVLLTPQGERQSFGPTEEEREATRRKIITLQAWLNGERGPAFPPSILS